MSLILFIITLLTNKVSSLSEVETTTVKLSDNCREENRLITSDKYEKYTLIEVTLNDTFILECNYW